MQQSIETGTHVPTAGLVGLKPPEREFRGTFLAGKAGEFTIKGPDGKQQTFFIDNETQVFRTVQLANGKPLTFPSVDYVQAFRQGDVRFFNPPEGVGRIDLTTTMRITSLTIDGQEYARAIFLGMLGS